MKIGKVSITLQRTIRVPDGRVPAQLPPGIGRFPVYRVDEYRDVCPETWEDGGVFIPMHDKEATWLSLQLTDSSPRALLVGAGNVNAITGKPLTAKLESPQNYVVVPVQPWLDGWKDTDGVIYQFVAVEFKSGEGLTVGEQILGDESKTGGIGIAVFAPKDESLTATKSFHEYPIAGPYDVSAYSQQTTMSMDASLAKGMRSASFTEMGLGRGGRIIQKIYPDPFGLDAWQDEPEATMAIYLVGAASFEDITKLKAPPEPPGFEDYTGPYFKLPDEQAADTEGAQIFAGLKSVFVTDENIEENLSESETY